MLLLGLPSWSCLREQRRRLARAFSKTTWRKKVRSVLALFGLSKAIPEDARLRGTVPLPSRQATQQGASMAELAASSAD